MSETPATAEHATPILFIGHDATRTGAPKSLLNIVRWIRQNTNLAPVVLLGKGGATFEDYAATCESYVWDPAPGSPESRSSPSRLGRLAVSAAQRLRLTRASGVLHRQLIRRRLSQLKPACVFNNTGVNGRLLENLLPNLNAPIVSRVPELEAFMRRNAAHGGLQRVLALSQHFVAVSNAVKENLERRHNIEAARISVVYGACEAREALVRDMSFRRSLGIADSELVVCGCGTMDWRKGFDLFVQTAHALVQGARRTDLKFVWMGAAVTQEADVELRYEIEALGLQANVLLLGEVKDPSRVFAIGDLFFLSSREDPFPLVMLEASSQGLPIVCFAGSGGATEFVQPEFGVIVPMLDTGAAAKAIAALLEAPGLGAMREAARAQACRYSVERMGEGVAKVLQGVVSAA